MTEQPRPSNEDALGFLRELVDRYGIDGLTERLAAAIEEAEARRVDAQLWTKRPSGWNKNKAPE